MSDTRSPWPLPERPSLDQLRKQAKELRDSEHHSSLTAAQFALARHYGYPSWPKLKFAVELTQLRTAIDEGDTIAARQLLEATPTLAAATFSDGSSPLHEAAGANRAEIVELIVRHGAPLQSRFGQSAHSALSWALTVQALDAARKLVELGSEPDLFCAAGLNDLERVKAFWRGDKVRRSPSKTGSSRKNAAGERLPAPPESDADQVSDALYIACRLGALETSRWLLDHGADPNWRGYCGAPSLAWADFSGNTALCALLRERGADEGMIDDTYKATPRVFGVMVFASWGFPDRLAARIAADPTLLGARAGTWTLLHAAAFDGQAACARLLLKLGIDRAAVDAKGRTAAQLAVEKGHVELAAMLEAPQ